MSAHDFSEPDRGRNGAMPIDPKMDQIRELLFGEFKRDSDARIALIDARVRELELGLNRKLDNIQSQLTAIASDLKSDRRASFKELSESVSELAERIRRISGE